MPPSTQQDLKPLALNGTLPKTLDRILTSIWKQAAREWLRELIKGIPVETGMAKGSLTPLGRFLNVAVPISPTRAPYFNKLEGVTATPDAGAAKTEFELETKNFTYTFTWSTDVLHYWLAQFYKGQAIPGEQLIKEADAVFQQFVTETVTRRVANELTPRRVPLVLEGFNNG